MTEATRGWIYRFAVFALVVYVAIAQPDHFTEWLPVILGLGSNALASLNTSVKG